LSKLLLTKQNKIKEKRTKLEKQYTFFGLKTNNNIVYELILKSSIEQKKSTILISMVQGIVYNIIVELM
jgi:hypothetical protein